MKRSFYVPVLAAILSTQAMTALAIDSGRYSIISRHSGLALEVRGGSSDDGANVVQWEYNGTANQQFDIENLGNGFHTIRPVHSGKSLDVWEWSGDPGGDIRQYQFTGNYNQQWAIDSAGGNYHTISSRHSGLPLDVWMWSTSNGGDIRQWRATGAVNQQWQFRPVGEGDNGGSGSDPGNPTDPTVKGSTCQSTGSQFVRETIVVNGGTYDGQCRTFNPSSALGDGGQGEGQKPVFRLENGATLKNVIIGQNGADGIHVYNGGTLENIRWTDVGEDAMTVKSEGNVTLRNIEGYNGSDKFLQANAASNITVSNCVVDNMGKFLRQNGGTTFEVNIRVDNCDISNMSEGVFRTDSRRSTAHISNSRLRNAGRVCIGNWASCTSSNLSNF